MKNANSGGLVPQGEVKSQKSKVKKLRRQAFEQFEIVALFTPCCPGIR
jgi:hypothetical protein